MSEVQRRALTWIVSRFARMDYADRRWLLSRLSADHRELPR